MRVVFIYQGNPQTFSILDFLDQNHDVYVIEEIPKSTLHQILRPFYRQNDDSRFIKLSRSVSLVVLGFYFFLRIKPEFKGYKSKVYKHSNTRKFHDINSDSAIEYVASLDPEMIITSGISILNRKWILSFDSMYNIHSGLLPEYRGRFCWLWPLLLGKRSHLGASVHSLLPKVDSGKVFVSIKLDPNEHEFNIRKAYLLQESLQLEAVKNFFETLDSHATIPSKEIAPTKAFLEPTIRDYITYFRNNRMMAQK